MFEIRLLFNIFLYVTVCHAFITMHNQYKRNIFPKFKNSNIDKKCSIVRFFLSESYITNNNATIISKTFFFPYVQIEYTH